MPSTVSEIAPKLDTFKAFVVARGGQIMEPTNEFEVLRIRANGRASVLYRKKNGRLSWTGPDLPDAWDAFSNGGQWRGLKRTKATKKGKRVRQILAMLRARDGDECFYCGKPVDEDAETIEHLMSLTHGGTWHASNLALAHECCNRRAGHLPIVEKVRLREKLRCAG